ncbi:VanW family protein [Fusicatenibacter faecihominis]|mgnify:FL=1|uniref:VanW family protein n=1 Tax=Fusicatenibacter faecihominis TaxID=2881276 RepID=A0AAE3DTN5_9FIRM|nr:VanW family protein [Fusicatenibacter faecihominis]MCC2190205.1 VanW family protein [Fusicatenibacter faecihominis]
MKKSKKAGLILTVGAALFLVAGAPALADETDTISKNVYIGGVNVSGMTEEQATKAVEEKLGKGTGGNYTVKIGDETTTATAENFGMEWTNREVVHEAMEVAKGGNLIKQYKDKKDLQVEPKNFEVAYAPNEQAVKTYVEKLAEEYNRDAEEGDITFANGYPEVTGGETGIAVNVDQSVSSIMKALEGDGTELTVVAEVQKPSVTKEELSQVKDVLGTATTYYGSSYERNTNVEVGASKINGTLIMPGETFSVTAAVTPFNADNGYYPAPSYESGQVVDTYGGGICQVSTTLYNAVLKAELQVDERHNHTMLVSYVDPSKDAAIAEGLMDFIFTNNTDAPIYIYGVGYQGTLNFTIYGHETRDPNRSISFRSETLSQTDASTNVKLVAKSDQNIGYLNQTQSAHQGLEAVLWKDIVNADGTTDTVQVNSSSYQASPAIYEVGIVSPNTQASAAIQTAIANNDLATVQAIINGSYGSTSTAQTEAPETSAPETNAPTTDTPETSAPETNAPETDAPTTDAPTTDAPVQDPSGDMDDNIPADSGEVTVIG